MSLSTILEDMLPTKWSRYIAEMTVVVAIAAFPLPHYWPLSKLVTTNKEILLFQVLLSVSIVLIGALCCLVLIVRDYHKKGIELENENKQMKDWNIEKKNYKKLEIGNGVFAYIGKDYEGKAQNAYKFCCNCFENRKIKSPLQQTIEPHRLIGLVCDNGCQKLVFFYIK